MASAHPPHTFSNTPYTLQNGAPSTSAPMPGATPLLPNNGRIIQNGAVRILCIADVRGNLKSLNDLAKEARADHIIHTGDFGFYDDSSLERIADKTLKHVAQYSPLLPESIKRSVAQVPPHQSVKQRFSPEQLPLSELPLLLNKQLTLDVPVYTVWGACEDVRVLEKFRSGEYKVDKLHIIDEANSRLLDIGGVKLRLLGLGGAVVMHKLFDNGEGKTTIAGGQGTMWTTLLQMGELVDTANRVYDPAETRVFVTHASPAREGMLNQLSVTLKADFSVSAGLHFRYGSSYNEFSVNPTLDHYRGKLAASKASFNDVWDTVREEVENAVNTNEAHKTLLDNALDIVQKMPNIANGGNPFGGPVTANNAGGQVDESAFKNMWNFNLADAAFGYLVLDVEGGRIGTEMRAQGFNFSHRGGKAPPQGTNVQQPGSTPAALGNATGPVANVSAASTKAPPQFGQAQAQATRPVGNQYSQLAQAAQATNKQQQAALPPKSTASPVPSVGHIKDKPATPKPATPSSLPAIGGNDSTDKRSATSASEANGSANPAKQATPQDKKVTNGLFISNVENEEGAKNIFPDEDKAKIIKVEKWGKFNHVVTFATPEDAKAALERQPAEHKKPSPPGPNRKPNVKVFEDRTHRGPRDTQGNAGTWQASGRGALSGNTRSGYQSGSATSDGEGGRGRGGYGGRGRGRGSDRGGRGGGRGSGRGGTFNRGPSTGESTAATSTPSTAATPATGGEKGSVAES